MTRNNMITLVTVFLTAAFVGGCNKGDSNTSAPQKAAKSNPNIIEGSIGFTKGAFLLDDTILKISNEKTQKVIERAIESNTKLKLEGKPLDCKAAGISQESSDKCFEVVRYSFLGTGAPENVELAPECGADSTKEIATNVATKIANAQTMGNKTVVLSNIRTEGTDKETGKRTCIAEATITEGTAFRLSRPITYTSEITSDKDHIVSGQMTLR